MHLVVIIFGDLTLLAGILIIVKPEIIFGYMRSNFERVEFYILAIVVRLLLGSTMIYTADVSRHPFAIEIIGWIALLGGISLIVMGRRNFNRIISWALSLLKPLARVGGVVAAAFGAFLVYSFV